jgi:hypothetical protein
MLKWTLPIFAAVMLPAASQAQLAPATKTDEQTLTARAIVERTFAATGGDAWRYPGTIWLKGRYLDFKAGVVPVVYEPYELYRVQPRDHPQGNLADGKIRVSAYLKGKAVMQVAFDGARTYDMNGPTGEGADAPIWRLTMGFGMIRFALDPGHTLVRLPDDPVDGIEAYTVRLTDPSGQSAVFSISKAEARIIKIAFPTPRGLHERYFSDFFTKPGVNWLQPGRVRSHINGVKEAEFLYDDFRIGAPMADTKFVIAKGQFVDGVEPAAR